MAMSEELRGRIEAVAKKYGAPTPHFMGYYDANAQVYLGISDPGDIFSEEYFREYLNKVRGTSWYECNWDGVPLASLENMLPSLCEIPVAITAIVVTNDRIEKLIK